MTDFGFVKTVDKCCGCIDLKIGSIIIAIIAILDQSDICLDTVYPFCKSSSDIVSTLLYIIQCLTFVSNIAMIITGITFIYGIIKGVRKTAVWFMYAIAASLILRILCIIIQVILGILFSGCTIFSYQLFSKIIGFLVWFYFLSVIKSYKEVM